MILLDKNNISYLSSLDGLSYWFKFNADFTCLRLTAISWRGKYVAWSADNHEYSGKQTEKLILFPAL